MYFDGPDLAAPAPSTSAAVALQTDGKLLLGGRAAGALTPTGYDSGGGAVFRFNRDGSIDPTFGAGGQAVPFGPLKYPTGENAAEVSAIEVLPDGRIFLAGWSPYSRMKSFARLNPDGTPDPTFDGDGFALVDVAEGPVRDVLALPDGRVMVAGGNPDSWVLRLTAGGTLDPSFAGRGMIVSNNSPSHPDFYAALAPAPDGTVLVGGGSNADRYEGKTILFSFNPDGSYRTTFASIDKGWGPDVFNLVYVLPDGKVLAASVGVGASYNGAYGGGRPDLLIARFNPDGTLDTTFGTGGTLTRQVNTYDDGNVDVSSGNGLFGPDGALYLAGRSYSVSEGVGVMRVNPDGTSDRSYGGRAGAAAVTGVGSIHVAALALGVDGSLGLAVNDSEFATNPVATAARFTPAGRPDTAFSGDAGAQAQFILPAQVQVRAVAPAAGGKVVAAGDFNNAVFVARRNADGTPDTTFDADGWTAVALPFEADGFDVVTLPDARTLVIGRSGQTDLFAMRLNPDGSRDPTFGAGGPDGDGVVSTRLSNFSTDHRLAVQTDGRLVVGATLFSNHTPGDTDSVVLLRYLPDGTLDASFGPGGADGDGVVTFRASTTFDTRFVAVAVAPGGNVVVAARGGGDGGSFLLARYLPDGSPDPAFGTAGVVVDRTYARGAPLNYAFLDDIALEADGRIVAVGTANVSPTLQEPVNDDGVLARYLPDGSPDTSLAGAGHITVDFGSTNDGLSRVLPRSDGSYLLVGGTVRNGAAVVALAHFAADGTRDAAFGDGGTAVVDLGAAGALAFDAAAAPGGEVLLAGRTPSGAVRSPRPMVARLKGDGAPAARVVGRHVFYNHSAFDGHNAAPTPGDDAAIAIDKAPLLPGHSATFANVTSYTRGINGVMIDVTAGLPMTALAGIAGSLGLKAGVAGDPATWPDAPRPSQIGIRAGAGVGGSDRITLVWPDGAIRNTWLRVTVRASPHSGLAADDVFTFGNLVGETGDGGALGVSTRDALDARSHRSARGVSIDSDYDHDRDGTVGVLDYSAALRNLGRSLTLASPPPAAAPAGAPSDVRRAPTRRTLLDAGVRDEGRA